jgi:uncharacterized protein YyaL (SSP411 family)
MNRNTVFLGNSYKTSLVLFLLLFLSCKTEKKQDEEHAYTNALIDETSPYLLQHAHNPVNWVPWSQEALEEAEKQDKLVIVSIGYSSCHWCHVMEEETFEDEAVAALMNENYISIKVDREERPDVDQIYMTAAQLMTGKGGWPLNVILLPNGKPLYGGTYHTNAQWTKVLTEINKLYREDKGKAQEYASRVAKGIAEVNIIEGTTENVVFEPRLLQSALFRWQAQWDLAWGGNIDTQKFILPGNLDFLMDYAALAKDDYTKNFVKTTLDKIALGGIYDHVGGGFFRYSTDPEWKVPHFEKMLYDNAQLLSLFSKAYTIYKDPTYKKIVLETIEFLDREMKNPAGGYYAAIDADSEGEEGVFYVWKEDELRSILGGGYKLFASYYNIYPEAIWENEQYVLHKTRSDSEFSKQHKLSFESLNSYKNDWNSKLLKERNLRVRPNVDDKIITSWNALLINGFVDAYKAFGNPGHLQKAEDTMTFLLKNAYTNNQLVHTYKEGSKQTEGFLEDYAFLSNASLSIYEASLNTTHLEAAKSLMTTIQDRFHDETSGMYYYNEDDTLISKIIKTDDGVLPSPNTVVAENLLKLGHLYYDTAYLDKAQSMMVTILPRVEEAMNNYAQWSSLMLASAYPYYEVVVVGPNARSLISELHKEYIPNALLAGSSTDSELPLYEDRYFEDDTYIYVCFNNTCKLPVETTKEALRQLRSF